MNAMLQKTLIALAIAALSLSVFASDEDCTGEPKSTWQKESDVQASLEKQGYAVKRIKTEGSCYAAYVTDKDGRKAELVINPVDGNLVKEEDRS